MDIKTRPVTPLDSEIWFDLRTQLWPECLHDEQRAEINAYFADTSERLCILLAETPSGEIVGFVEVSIRTGAEGCQTDRIGYIEGWFVVPGWRGKGVGKHLVHAAETWARRQGCSEMASDAKWDNAGSIAAHQRLGYGIVGKMVCFYKQL